MFTHILSIMLLAATLVGCERSSRNVEVQPISNGKLPDSDTGDKPTPDDDTGSGDSTKKVGQINLTLSGAETASGSASVAWTFNGASQTATATLSNGSGTTLLSNVPSGSSTLTVKVTINSLIYNGSASVIVSENSAKSVSLNLVRDTSGGGGGGGGGGQQPTPPNPTGGDSDVIINPTIGGNPTPTPTSLWDGKSFRGNSKWSIEAVN